MKNNQTFAFSKENYLLILGGLLVVIIGFLLMSGGGSDDPNVFKGEYTLTTESFDKLINNFGLDQGVITSLKPLEGKVFPSEEELKSAISSNLGTSFDSNYFAIRSATHIDAEIFSTRRITVAPIVVLLGYIVILIGVMRRKKEDILETTNNTQLTA